MTGIGSAFMSVPPSTALHFHLPSDRYRLGLKWWLGLPLISVDTDACPGCGQQVDPWGDHLLCCARNNYLPRHNTLQTILCDTLAASGQGHQMEVKIPGHEPDKLRPADILLLAWDGGRDTALDLTVCHGWQVKEQRAAVVTATTRERWRCFLKRREAAKHQKYDAPCQIAGWSMLAMAFGTWGGMGPEGARTISRIQRRAQGWQEGELCAQSADTLRHRLGFALMDQVIQFLANKNFINFTV